MTFRIDQLLIALMFALLAAGVTLIAASAQEGTVPPLQTSPDCATCHTESQATWQNGAHGKSGGDPGTTIIQADGVVPCASCHGPVPADHPKSPVPVVRSAELCSRCHTDTRSEAQTSTIGAHDPRGLDCATCHDPHSTSLKAPPGPRTAEKTDEVSQLCITCHQESNMDFSLTAHAQRNVSCADCHVNRPEKVENPNGTTNTPPDHSFKASLASCNTCHVQQMHSPTEAVNTKEATLPLLTEPTAEVQPTSIKPEPEAVSPLGFSAMAGLIGLAGGMVLAPWLERWYRRTVKQNREDKDA